MEQDFCKVMVEAGQVRELVSFSIGICQEFVSSNPYSFLTPIETLLHLSPKTAAAAKLLQSCPTLCDLIHGSPPGSAVIN